MRIMLSLGWFNLSQWWEELSPVERFILESLRDHALGAVGLEWPNL